MRPVKSKRDVHPVKETYKRDLCTAKETYTRDLQTKEMNKLQNNKAASNKMYILQNTNILQNGPTHNKRVSSAVYWTLMCLLIRDCFFHS